MSERSLIDSTDVAPPYEQIAAMSEVEFFRLMIVIFDYEAARIWQTQEVLKKLYGHPEWAPMAAQFHHACCAVSGLLGKWISAVEDKPNPFITRSRDILRDGILAEIKLLNPTVSAKS